MGYTKIKIPFLLSNNHICHNIGTGILTKIELINIKINYLFKRFFNGFFICSFCYFYAVSKKFAERYARFFCDISCNKILLFNDTFIKYIPNIFTMSFKLAHFASIKICGDF